MANNFFERAYKDIFGIEFEPHAVNTYSNFELQKLWNRAIDETRSMYDECEYMPEDTNPKRLYTKVVEPIKHYTIGLDEEWTHLGHDEIICHHLTKEEATEKILGLARATVVQNYGREALKDEAFIKKATEYEAKKYFMTEERQ